MSSKSGGKLIMSLQEETSADQSFDESENVLGKTTIDSRQKLKLSANIYINLVTIQFSYDF